MGIPTHLNTRMVPEGIALDDPATGAKIGIIEAHDQGAGNGGIVWRVKLDRQPPSEWKSFDRLEAAQYYALAMFIETYGVLTEDEARNAKPTLQDLMDLLNQHARGMRDVIANDMNPDQEVFAEAKVIKATRTKLQAWGMDDKINWGY